MVWVSVAVVYLWLFSASMFLASIGPPVVMAKIATTQETISLQDLKKAVSVYAQEASNKLNIDYNYVLLSLAANVLLFLPTLFIGLFALRKRLWARKSLIALLAVFLVYPFTLALFTSVPLFSVINFNQLPLLAFIILLTRDEIKCVFT